MIIYLCIKYEFNTLFFSKDNQQEPFFISMDGMYGCDVGTVVIVYATTHPTENGGRVVCLYIGNL